MGAGSPAKNPTRCMAPATPVFAGEPAPTGCGGMLAVFVLRYEDASSTGHISWPRPHRSQPPASPQASSS
ncbi:hypothetical protein E8E78_00285 [Pseudomonas sp. BN505]|nr:hypothetical protein [Pseudomonas sp. BN605]MDH4855064.1 hypothetical protein [Pseudomonas sp. BN505]